MSSIFKEIINPKDYYYDFKNSNNREKNIIVSSIFMTIRNCSHINENNILKFISLKYKNIIDISEISKGIGITEDDTISAIIVLAKINRNLDHLSEPLKIIMLEDKDLKPGFSKESLFIKNYYKNKGRKMFTSRVAEIIEKENKAILSNRIIINLDESINTVENVLKIKSKIIL